MRAKLYTVHGFTGTLSEISDHFKINISTLRSRLHAGWSLSLATSTPVDKSKSVHIPPMYEIGEEIYSLTAVEKRFGIVLDSNLRKNNSAVIAKIRTYHSPEFYSVGRKYKGSLIAISEDFGCPLSELKTGIKAGKSVSDILMSGGYFGENKK